MILNVGTRGSKLSLIQTDIVLKNLKQIFPELNFNIKIIKTLGDLEDEKPLFTIDRKGIFEKEINQALIHNEIDFAVHSLKDVPIFNDDELIIAAIPKRESPLEALVSINKLKFNELPRGAIIGTSSLRRMIQIKHLRSDLEVKPMRGNIDTRIKKIQEGYFHAAILSLAGLERLGFKDLAAEIFPPEVFTPPAGQGALAIVIKRDRGDLMDILKAIDHFPTRAEVTAERSLINKMQGGCHFPIGAFAKAEENKLFLYGCIFSINGLNKIEASAEASINEAEALGNKVANMLLSKGADEIKNEWRMKYGIW
ncbi:MAG: hydroxymethylbilane synthase [Candidatus Methanomethyliaceae archaeon]|nr:hydroxymethylbilane synthase [Candidatus Methanomethyliaceae archaeon]MDW7971359.1 hydroxymethylbilane synthase [Nitrososphaerota archaeon]